MPFSADNSWPAGLLKIFEINRVMNVGSEKRYYGPYDKLLNYCFGDSFTFYITPQSPPEDESTKSVDCVVFLIVFDALRRPVLIAEVRSDHWANNPGLRLEADEQLRRWYNIMLHDCPIPRLWGLSLLGTSVRLYRGDVATSAITPPYQARSYQDFVVTPSFLEGEWDLDILSQEGFDKMKEIVADITTATVAL